MDCNSDRLYDLYYLLSTFYLSNFTSIASIGPNKYLYPNASLFSPSVGSLLLNIISTNDWKSFVKYPWTIAFSPVTVRSIGYESVYLTIKPTLLLLVVSFIHINLYQFAGFNLLYTYVLPPTVYFCASISLLV